MKEKIAIIGASYLQLPLIEKAKEMGLETHVFAWAAGDVGEKAADRFYPISIIEKEQILEACREIAPAAVCTIASDLAGVTVNYVANRLGLAANPPESIGPCTNKFQMREALHKAGVRVPRHVCFAQGAAAVLPEDMTYPVIVKPTDRSGSRGIMKVQRPQELAAAVDAAAAYSFEKKAIAEEFIEGPEYSCESVSCKGRHTVVAVTKKFTTNAPHFIETGHLEPSDLNEAQLRNVMRTVCAALDALGITTGISHSEFRMSPADEPRIIEVGARMGGDCIGSDLVRLSTGMDFVRMAIDTALGRAPDLRPVCRPQAAAIRFIFGPEDLQILQSIRDSAPEALYRAERMGELASRKIVDSSTRFGYFIVTDPSAARVRELIRL